MVDPVFDCDLSLEDLHRSFHHDATRHIFDGISFPYVSGFGVGSLAIGIEPELIIIVDIFIDRCSFFSEKLIDFDAFIFSLHRYRIEFSQEKMIANELFSRFSDDDVNPIFFSCSFKT
jgi:hypothetical protein